MPVFQPYTPQVVPDIGSTPQVRTGGEAIGQGLQNLGQGLSSASQDLARIQMIQARKEEYQTSVNTDDFKAKQNAAFQQQLQTAPASGDGFAKSTLDNYDKAAAQYLTTVPESQRQRAQNDIMLHRDALAEQAAGKEHEIGNAYVLGTLKDSYNASREAVTLHPDTRDTVQQGLFQRIDKAYYLEPAQKVELKRDYINGLSFQQVKGIAPDNPAKVRELQGMPVTTGQSTSTSAPGDYLSKIRQHESGGNDSADNGTAVGRYQFTSGTWASVAKSHPDLGLTPAGRTDPAQQEKAIRAFTADNQATLQSAGIAPTNANTYMAHFLGSGGAIKFINAMQQDPNQSAAAIFGKEAANNKGVFYDRHTGGALSLGQVYDIQTRMFGGSAQSMPRVPTGGPAAAGAHPQAGDVTGSTQQQSSGPDPRFSSLTPEQWDQLHESAQRTQIQQNTAANTAATQAQKALVDSLQTDIINGKAGVSDVKPYLDRQQITPDQYLQLQGQVEKRDKDAGDAGSFIDGLKNNATFNRFDTQTQDHADAAFKKMGGSLDALDTIYRGSGIVPKSAVTQMKTALFGQNAQSTSQALQIGSNIMAGNPNAFKGVDGGEDIQNAVVKYNHFIGTGETTQSAVQKVMQQNDPNYKPTVKVTDTDLKTFQDNITVSSISSSFSQWFPNWYKVWGNPQIGGDPQQQSEIVADFKQVATDAYQQSGDPKLAMSQAKDQLSRVYGVTTAFGTPTLTKYPPEKAYPPVANDTNGGYGYIARQAVDAIKQETGHDVDPANVTLLPIPGSTQSAFAANQPPPYQLAYTWTKPDGQQQHDVIYGKGFVADPAAAQKQIHDAAQPGFEAYDAWRQGELQQDQAARESLKNLYGGILTTNTQPSQVETDENARAAANTAKAKAITPPPVQRPISRTPTSGSGAFQQEKEDFTPSVNGGDGYGGSGVGM